MRLVKITAEADIGYNKNRQKAIIIIVSIEIAESIKLKIVS